MFLINKLVLSYYFMTIFAELKSSIRRCNVVLSTSPYDDMIHVDPVSKINHRSFVGKFILKGHYLQKLLQKKDQCIFLKWSSFNAIYNN